MRRVRAEESISTLLRLFLTPSTKNMKSLEYINTCLLLFYIVAISVQQVSSKTDINDNNSNITADDAKYDMHNITSCVMETKTIGPIINRIVEFINWIFVILPGQKRDQIIAYSHRIFQIFINAIVSFNELIQSWMKYATPLMELSALSR